jgi:membrane-associated phospholipid phosphatase
VTRAALALALLLALSPGTCAAAEASRPHSRSLLEWSDAGVLLFTAAGIELIAHEDLEISENAPSARGRFARDVGSFGEHFGNPLYSAPLLGVAYLAGRVGNHPGLSRSALRIAGGMASAAVAAGGLKFLVGRYRPYESPGDPSRFDALSSRSAFPSGHTTIAFSLAAGIDRETRAQWIPFVVYPAAAISGWSRLRDNKHWASDVLAGAVIGVWTSGRFDRVVGGPDSRMSLGLGPVIDPAHSPIALGATLRF